MAEDMFDGLPPPSAAHDATVEQERPSTPERRDSSPFPIPPLRPPALKKRDKPPESPAEVAPQKRLRFKTTVDATEAQVIEAMKKITSHIKVPAKFSKASKLAVQLIHAGSVTPENSDHFFALLDVAMSSPTACNEPSLRADYHALFSAAQEVTQCFNKQQKNLLATWMIRALVANDLYTDDSFVKKKKKKMSLASPLRHKASSAKASASDEIPTPEKPAQLPWRTGKRSLSFSVSDVRRVAMGLQMTRNNYADRSDLPRSDSELQRRSQSCSDLGTMKSAVRSTAKLSETYEMLAEYFNCLDSSIRLLRLKGALSTFTNISASIQHLTERRFTYRHLAQMKHILPEAISIKKVVLRDEATCCMKPELQVSLQVDAVEGNLELKGESAYSALRKVFRARLVEFAREHPEEDEIPEETLPHPFGHTKPSMSTESNKLSPSIPTGASSVAHPVEKLTKVSHFSASFQRRFSARTPSSDEMKTPLASLNDVATNVDSLVSSFPYPVKFSSKPPIHKKSLFSSPGKRPLVIHHQQIEQDSNVVTSAHNSIPSGLTSSESTPVKDIPTSATLMTTTPELKTPKRSRKPTIDDTPQKVIVKRATRIKLFPTPRKNVKSDGAENLSTNSPVENDVLGFLPESLLQDIRDKENIAMEERDTNVVGARLRKKIIASLPKLFDSILLIFQSGNRSVITKQELVHKILSCHCSVVDRNEVEEQLELMEELVPDWIFRKAAATGDILYRVNKMSSSQGIRQRLAVAE